MLWAPTWDYFAHVFIPLVNKMGVNAKVTLLQRGYYPKGGGKAVLTVNPTPKVRPFIVDAPQAFKTIEGIIHLSGLPDHIATRMKHAALKEALAAGLEGHIMVETVSAASQGVGITLWSSTEKTILGSGVLGERRVSAEQVGTMAASRLLADIKAGATLDSYAIDQLLPYMMASPDESRCLVRECSSHTKTNIWVLQQFEPRRMEMSSPGALWRVVVGAANL